MAYDVAVDKTVGEYSFKRGRVAGELNWNLIVQLLGSILGHAKWV